MPIRLADLLIKTFAVDSQDAWENKRTPTPVRQFGVRIHTAGLSIREMVAVLELLSVERSHRAVRQWIHRLADSESDLSTATPSGVAVDETAVQLGTEWHWLYAAVDLDSLYLLNIAVFSRHSADPAAAFLHKLTENDDVSETKLLIDAYDYRTVSLD